MADEKNEGVSSTPGPPPPAPAESKPASDSQFPRPTMQVLQGSLGETPQEGTLNLSKYPPPKK
jgi:hypothetical protein